MRMAWWRRQQSFWCTCAWNMIDESSIRTSENEVLVSFGFVTKEIHDTSRRSTWAFLQSFLDLMPSGECCCWRVLRWCRYHYFYYMSMAERNYEWKWCHHNLDQKAFHPTSNTSYIPTVVDTRSSVLIGSHRVPLRRVCSYQNVINADIGGIDEWFLFVWLMCCLPIG